MWNIDTHNTNLVLKYNGDVKAFITPEGKLYVADDVILFYGKYPEIKKIKSPQSFLKRIRKWLFGYDTENN